MDDKDNLVASLMLMLMLKRANAPLDRDVIFLAESGEEGTPQVGAQFMIDKHFDAIDAEFCLAEGGGVVRTGGQIQRANVGTTEKEPRAVELIARGPAGHGSVPQQSNAVALLIGGGGQGRRVDAAAAGQRNDRDRTSGRSPRWWRLTSRSDIATSSAPIRRCHSPRQSGC